MKANLGSTELTLKLWRQCYQTYTLLKKCEDQVFGEHGLTTEQGAVLGAIDYFGGSMKITDIAQWLERSTNSVSMQVDRMVKAGLVRRARSTDDRREVRVTNTSKGRDALKPANLAGLEAVQKILSPLSHEDRLTLLSLLETIKYEIIRYLNPGADIEEIKRNELKQAANLAKWLSDHGLTSTPQAKRQGVEKRKTT
jgi:DNA-binding MarR family transcriptional regulator